MDWLNIIKQELFKPEGCIDETMVECQGTDAESLRESHQEREILLIFSGSGSFTLANSTVQLAPGTAIFLNSWTPHQRDYHTSRCSGKHIWLHFHKDKLIGSQLSIFASGTFTGQDLGTFNTYIDPAVRRRWDAALSQKDVSMRKYYYHSAVRLILEELQLKFEQGMPKQKETEVCSSIQHYIAMNIGRNSSLEELEKFTGYNRFYISRAFRRKFGYTIGDYINHVRRGYTATAIPKGMSQKEIAANLGFKSPAAFWLWKTRDSKKHGR